MFDGDLEGRIGRGAVGVLQPVGEDIRLPDHAEILVGQIPVVAIGIDGQLAEEAVDFGAIDDLDECAGAVVDEELHEG